MAAHPQRQDGHGKALVRIQPRLAEGEKLLERDAHRRRIIAEVFPHQLDGKGVIAGRDGRVRGEDIAGRDDLERGAEIELVFGDLAADQLQGKEGGVAFIHVVHGRRDAHRIQRVHAADAEHDLLLYPHLLVAAVKLRRDQAVFLGVLHQIGVQHVKRDAPHEELPDFHAHRTGGDFHRDEKRLAVLVLAPA